MLVEEDETRAKREGAEDDERWAREQRGRGWATLSDEPASREIDSSILCAAARGLVLP